MSKSSDSNDKLINNLFNDFLIRDAACFPATIFLQSYTRNNLVEDLQKYLNNIGHTDRIEFLSHTPYSSTTLDLARYENQSKFILFSCKRIYNYHIAEHCGTYINKQFLDEIFRKTNYSYFIGTEDKIIGTEDRILPMNGDSNKSPIQSLIDIAKTSQANVKILRLSKSENALFAKTDNKISNKASGHKRDRVNEHNEHDHDEMPSSKKRKLNEKKEDIKQEEEEEEDEDDDINMNNNNKRSDRDHLFELIEKIESNNDIKLEFWDHLNWEFDAVKFDQNEIIAENGMIVLFHHLCKIKNWYSLFKVNDAKYKLLRFMKEIQSNYKQNEYHNRYHAVDVMLNVYYFMKLPSIQHKLTDFDQFMTVLAAAVHDTGHDGLNNDFHERDKSDLYTTHFTSTLERYHISFALKLLYGTNSKQYDWYNDFRDNRLIEKWDKYLIEMILKTDMNLHDECIKIIDKIKDLTKWDNMNDTINACALILHSGDIANPTKPTNLCIKWAQRLKKEWEAMGDEEYAKWNKVFNKHFDRNSPLFDSQIGCIHYILPYFNKLNNDIFNGQIQDLINNLNTNNTEWNKQKEESKSLCDDKN